MLNQLVLCQTNLKGIIFNIMPIYWINFILEIWNSEKVNLGTWKKWKDNTEPLILKIWESKWEEPL